MSNDSISLVDLLAPDMELVHPGITPEKAAELWKAASRFHNHSRYAAHTGLYYTLEPYLLVLIGCFFVLLIAVFAGMLYRLAFGYPADEELPRFVRELRVRARMMEEEQQRARTVYEAPELQSITSVNHNSNDEAVTKKDITEGVMKTVFVPQSLYAIAA